MCIFWDITIYSILHSYAEQNDLIVISHKIDIENFTLSVVPAQYCIGYTAKKNSGLEYWVQLLFNFTLVSVGQV